MRRAALASAAWLVARVNPHDTSISLGLFLAWRGSCQEWVDEDLIRLEQIERNPLLCHSCSHVTRIELQDAGREVVRCEVLGSVLRGVGDEGEIAGGSRVVLPSDGEVASLRRGSTKSNIFKALLALSKVRCLRHADAKDHHH
jgi:hypothetical protein